MVGFGDLWEGLGRGVGRISGAGAGLFGGTAAFLNPNRPVDSPYGNPLSGLWHGAVKAPWKEPYSAKQVNYDVGIYGPDQEREWWMSPLEFAQDIATDPTTYAGGIGKAVGGAGKLGKIAESAGKFGTLGEDASRIERLAQSGRRFAHGTTLGAGDPAFGMLYAGAPKALELAGKVFPGAKSAAVEKLLATKGGQAVARTGQKALSRTIGEKLPEQLTEADLGLVSRTVRGPVGQTLTPNAPSVVAPVAKKAVGEIPESLSERDLGLLDELWPTQTKVPKVKTKINGKPVHPAIEALMGGNKAVGKEQKAVVEAANEALDPFAKTIGAPEPNIADALAARDLPTAQRNAAIEAADEALLARRGPKAKKPKPIKDARPPNAGMPSTPEEVDRVTREMRKRAASEALPEFLRSTPTPPTLAEVYERPEIKKLRGAAKNAAANKVLRSFGQSA